VEVTGLEKRRSSNDDSLSTKISLNDIILRDGTLLNFCGRKFFEQVVNVCLASKICTHRNGKYLGAERDSAQEKKKNGFHFVA